MKNKLLHSLYLMVASVSAVNADYYQPTYQQPMQNDNWYCGDYNQAPTCNTSYDMDCDVYDAYSYVTLGVGPIVVIPNIGFGYRERHAQLGWDAAASFSTIGYMHQVSLHAVGHYYFNRCNQNSPYVGLGLTGSYVFCSHKGVNGGILSPDFVFGKEFLRTGDSRQFIEMHVGIPTVWMDSRHVKGTSLPLMYIKYGFSF